MNLLDLFVKISVDDQASKNVGTLSDKIGKGLEKAAKIGVAGVTAAAAGITALTKASVEQYAEYEQLVGGVETLFKESAGTVRRYASEAYKTAGLDANAYLSTITSFSASLLQSLGGDTAAAAEYAHEAVVDMSDNANKMGTDMQMIQNAYQGFAKQNYSMLDNLKLGYGGTSAEMYRLMQDAAKMNEQFAETAQFSISASGQLTASFADITKAIHIVQENMGIAKATSQEAATTISGSANMMKSAWTNLVTGMADENADFSQLVVNFVESAETVWVNLEPRIDTALNGAVLLIENMGPRITEKVPALIETVLPMFFNAGLDIVSAIGDGIGKEIPFLSGVFGDLEYIVIAVTAALVAYKGAVIALKVISEIKKETEGMTTAQAALNLVMNANPIGLVVSLLAGLSAALITAWKTNEDFRNGVKEIWSGIKTFFTDTLGGLTKSALTWGSDMIDNFVSGIKQKWENLKKTVSDAAQTVKDFLGFSEPKEGPLSNFHTYAPDMMDLFAKGIRDNEHVVTDQIAKSFDFGQRTIDFASSAQGKSSAAMIHGMMLSDQSEPKNYVAELYLDGEKVAESTYKPTKKIQKREGEPALA